MSDQNKPDNPGITKALAEAQHPLYLGDPAVVEGLLRPYIKLCADEIAAAIDKKQTTADAAAKIEAAQPALARVLLGQDTAYQPMGDWNTSAKLPLFLAAQLGLPGGTTPSAIVAGSLSALAGGVCDVNVLYVQDPAVDWRGMLDDLLASFTGLFCGVPLPSDQA